MLNRPSLTGQSFPPRFFLNTVATFGAGRNGKKRVAPQAERTGLREKKKKNMTPFPIGRKMHHVNMYIGF